jgi:2,4-dienoyl-CoA reductase-like NADH-dependent reductase (Old Yellow Enzyme family)
MGFEKLFEPIKLGNVELKNRFSLAPTSAVQEQTGLPMETNFAYLAARAKGGAALIHTGSVQGTKRAWFGQSEIQHQLYDGTHVGAYSELTEIVHAFGAKAFIQLSLGLGNRGFPVDGNPPLAPSPIMMKELPGDMPDHEDFKEYFNNFPHIDKMLGGTMGPTPRPFTTEEIQEEMLEYANSARLACSAGFDGIEIHACHGYLLDQFRSELSNQREDQYGGSVENRNRIIVEITKLTMEKVWKDFPKVAIGVRLSADEHVEGGYTFEETLVLAKALAELGVTHFDISSASRLSFKNFIPDIDGTNMKYAKAIKEATGIPVLCNNIAEPQNMLKAVEEGYCDVINLCRALMADPEIPNKIKDGKIDKIVKCTRCYVCTLRLTVYRPAKCLVNPNVGRERYMPEYWRPAVAPRCKEDLLPPEIHKRK